MVGEAVTEFKRGIVDGDQEKKECKVELPITAHLSTEYVPSDRLRLDIYRRLADADSFGDVDGINEELKDRFGDLPEEASRLLEIAKLRIVAKSLEISDLAIHGRHLRISPIALSESLKLRIERIYPGTIYKSVTKTLLVARPAVAAWSRESSDIGDTSLLEWVSEVLAQLKSREVKA
jgi:transcription-repair coupling factor (superfamily II helicase)